VDKIDRYVQQVADRRTSILSKFIERGVILVRPSTNELVHDARLRADLENGHHFVEDINPIIRSVFKRSSR